MNGGSLQKHIFSCVFFENFNKQTNMSKFIIVAYKMNELEPDRPEFLLIKSKRAPSYLSLINLSGSRGLKLKNFKTRSKPKKLPNKVRLALRLGSPKSRSREK